MKIIRPLRSLTVTTESDDLFDYTYVRHVIGWVLRGAVRHKLLSLGVFTVTMLLGIAWMLVAPRTYHVEAKLLASRSQMIRSLGNPRTSGSPFEDPTRAAEETVFARDNLLSLIKQTKLMESVEKNRSIFSRARTSVVSLFTGPMTEEDRLDALVLMLEKKLHVVTDSQTVLISIDWPDAEAAYQVVETAQQNFLEARHVSEMTAIGEALAILQMHASAEQKNVTDSLLELQRVRELRRGGSSTLQAATFAEKSEKAVRAEGPSMPQLRNEPPAGQLANEQELGQLKFLYHSKRRALADLEDFRAKRLAELNAQLIEQRVQYAEKHPAVLDIMQRIAALSEASPQILQVRQEVAALLSEYRRKGGLNSESLVEPRRRPFAAKQVEPSTPGSLAQEPVADLSDDPEVEYARNNLRVASASYEELNMRIDSARIEQDTARAAFKYRYSVVRPPTLPKKPIQPNLELLFMVTVAAALFFTLLGGALLEAWRGVIVESWQVSQRLGLPVLGEVKAA